MRVLIVGNGAREHKLARRIVVSPRCSKVYVASGNAGISSFAECIAADENDATALTLLALEHNVDFVVVGPELPLALGIGSRLMQRGIAVFGPSEFAALIESRKWWAKQFMLRHGIPTAYGYVGYTAQEIHSAATQLGFPGRAVVLKADGLASGKGVYMIDSKSALRHAVKELIEDRRFGASAPPVVVEECLVGEEVSVHVISDGEYFSMLPDACDYKRAYDGDKGSNTGGMGAHSPSGLMTPKRVKEIRDQVFEPAIAGMRMEGHPFCGVLYAGLMLTPHGIRVLEFNARFGDPECQVVLPRIKNDILDVMYRAATGCLKGWIPDVRAGASVCVVLAGPGYPDDPRPAGRIDGIGEAEQIPSVTVLHANTRQRGNVLFGGTGRVLSVCAEAENIEVALEKANQAAERITFEHGVVKRLDIGNRYRTE